MRRNRLLAMAFVIATTGLVPVVAAPAQAGVCTAGVKYYTSTSYGTKEILGKSPVFANRTQNNVSVTRTASSQSTKSGSVTTSVSMGPNFLIAKATVDVGATFEYSVTKGTSDSLTFTVRPGYKGHVEMSRRPTLTTVQQRYYSPNCSYYVMEKGNVRGSSVKWTAVTSKI